MDNFMDKLAQRLTAQEMIKANSAADAAELERLQKQLDQYDACLQEMRKLSLKNVETTDKIGELLEEGIRKIQSYQTNGEDVALKLDALKGELSASEKALAMFREEINASMEGINTSVKDTNTSVKETNTSVKETNTSMEEVSAFVKEVNASVKEVGVSVKEVNASMEGLNASGEKLQTFIDGFTPSMEGFLEKANDYVHKENVKVYRNVQAVVVEEAKKQTEALENRQKKEDGREKITLVFTVLTFLVVAADIALNLLEHFNLF